MSRSEAFFHGTDTASANNIMRQGFKAIGEGDFGRGDYMTPDKSWAAEHANFEGDGSPGRIVQAEVHANNPLVHHHGDKPKNLNDMVAKAHEMGASDEFVQKLKEGHEWNVAEMSGHVGHDAYIQPGFLAVVKRPGIAMPVGLINKRQFNGY